MVYSYVDVSDVSYGPYLIESAHLWNESIFGSVGLSECQTAAPMSGSASASPRHPRHHAIVRNSILSPGNHLEPILSRAN
jgi:hypothetical protein